MDFDPHAAVPISVESRSQEEELLREPVERELAQATVLFWNKLSSLTSTVVDKSMEVAKVCQLELESLASEVKVEAADIYSGHLASSLQQAKEVIPTLLPSKVKDLIDHAFALEPHREEIPLHPVANPDRFERSFLLAEDTQDSWTRFKEQVRSDHSFSPIHQSTILENDRHLKDLYEQTVPSLISSELFWARWRFWRSVRSRNATTVNECEIDDAVNISLGDDAVNSSLGDDAVNSSRGNTCASADPANLQRAKNQVDDDWDSWE